jgi:peroxiredoxin
VGDHLPDFSIEVIDGVSRTLFNNKSLKGTSVIVFFHTGCTDCQRELPELNAYYLRHCQEPGFQMVAIAREESASEVAAFWLDYGLSIPYSPQPDRRVYNLFADMTIPRVYVSSPQGIVEWVGIERFSVDF